MTYWRRDDKTPLCCLKYHRCLPHYSGDWQLQLPSQQDGRAASTEAWVAVMILYGVMKRVLQHQQFMIEPFFFCFSEICFGGFMSHTELSLPSAENCNFLVFLPSAFFFFKGIIRPGTHQNTPFTSILVRSTEEAERGWLVLATVFCLWLLKTVKSGVAQPRRVVLRATGIFTQLSLDL